VVVGCRALLVLHAAAGHPLLATTHRGDMHLTVGAAALLARYEQAAGLQRVARVVVDREGLAAAFLREVAPARYTLALPDDPTRSLDLRVALIRDLTRQVPCAGPASPRAPWEADHDAAGRPWGAQGWVATPAPAPPTTPKLVPIVTTAAEVDPLEVAQT
jgi:hypothetical protein